MLNQGVAGLRQIFSNIIMGYIPVQDVGCDYIIENNKLQLCQWIVNIAQKLSKSG